MKSCKKPLVTVVRQAGGHGGVLSAKKLVGKIWKAPLFLSAAVLLFGVPMTSQAADRGHVLDAIHQVENPRNSTSVGPCGELGPYQIRPVVWRSYTKKPFELAADRVEAQIVAEQHYEWLKRGLERNGLEASPYHIALAWNAGLHATINRRASEHSRYYAQRVANIVEQHRGPVTAALGER